MPTGMDHVADKNAVELARFSKFYEFPQFVKTASLEATLNPGKLTTSVYADPVRRQFPCHDAPSTWLSALYFQEKKAEFHPKDQAHIQQRLDGYVDYFHIKAAVDKMRQQWADRYKTAEAQLPDSAYAYVWVGDDGHKDRRLRLTNRMEVKAAAEWLHVHCDRVPFTDRHVIAKKIMEKAAHFGASLGDEREFVERQAGLGVCDPAEVVQMIQHRALLVKDAELKEQFIKMAATFKAAPRKALMPAMLVKLAETLDILDRRHGLVGKYSAALPRPEDVIFKATHTKVASAMVEHVATTSGKVYEKQAFKQLALSDLKDLFGSEFAERISTPLGAVDPEKMAEEVATLPRPDAELLDSLLSDSGVIPALHKAASVRQGFSQKEMQAWAEAYQTVQ